MQFKLCAIALFAMSLFAKDSGWQQGKLVNLSVTAGTQKNGKPIDQKTIVFSVDAGDKVYDGQEVNKKPPHVEVNSQVTYKVSKDNLWVKDSDGKMHKLTLIKTTRKE